MLIRISVLALGLLRLSIMALLVQLGFLSKYRFAAAADIWQIRNFRFWAEYGPKGQAKDWRFRK